MKRVLPLGLLCSLVAACLASGTEGQDISSIGDTRESSVVSSLLPESQGSTYLLAFPVDDSSSNDHSEQVHAGGGGTSESAAEENSPAEKEGKEEVLTVMLSAGDPKDEEKNDVMVPIQDLHPKEEVKFFAPPPPFIPFRNKPTYQERKFPFPPPFQKLRPTILPPMRNLLQALRRDPPTNRMPPINFLSAASLLRRALSSRLRMLNDRYQAPIVMEEKLVPLPVSPPPEPMFPLPRSPMPMFMPLPETAEPTFMPPLSPLHPLFMFNAPPFMPPPMPLHPALLSPPFMHPFSMAPTPFMLPPPPPFLYHSFRPRRIFHVPPPMPLYHPSPFPPFRLSPPPLPPPPPFMQHPPHQIEMPEPLHVPLHEPTDMQTLQEMHPNSQRGPEEVVLIPSQEETPSSEEPAYVLLYPSEPEMPQTEMTSRKRSLLDLLRPRAGKVRHVIQQTRIITHYKPDFTGLFKSQLEPPSSFHKPIFRINDV